MTRIAIMAAAALALCGAGGAAAKDAAADARAEGRGIVSEVKLGLLQHDVEFLPVSREDGQALNAEVLFRSPAFLDVIWSPRPHLGASLALEGRTDQVYGGLTWTFRPFDEGGLAPLWVSAFGGGAVHDGETSSRDPNRKSLGSPVLFRFGAEIGYDVTERVNLSVHYSHISNAYIADFNEGLDHAGVRIGLRF